MKKEREQKSSLSVALLPANSESENSTGGKEHAGKTHVGGSKQNHPGATTLADVAAVGVTLGLSPTECAACVDWHAAKGKVIKLPETLPLWKLRGEQFAARNGRPTAATKVERRRLEDLIQKQHRIYDDLTKSGAEQQAALKEIGRLKGLQNQL